MKSNFEQGSQPLSPTTALNLAGYGLPFPYFPWAKQVAEYSAVAAPILKPPTPSLTVQEKFQLGWYTTTKHDSIFFWSMSQFFSED